MMMQRMVNQSSLFTVYLTSGTNNLSWIDTHTQNFELKQLRKEVQQLKKDQQQTCKLVDKLQAELDLERKARTSAEESLQNKQTTLESNQKMMRYYSLGLYMYSYTCLQGMAYDLRLGKTWRDNIKSCRNNSATFILCLHPHSVFCILSY